MIKIRKTKPGVTLIETLLYSVMLGIFIISVTVFAWDVSVGKIKNDSQAEVTDNAEIAIAQISGLIRNGKSIDSPATKGVPASTLVLSMPDGSKNTFDMVNGRLRITNSTTTRVPLDIILTIDVSGSMSGAPLSSEKTAASSFIDHLDITYDRIGIVSFSTSGTLRQPLTADFEAAKAAVNGLTASGMTNYQDGILKSTAELTSANHRPDASQVMVFMSDGLPNICNGWGCNPTQSAKAAADSAKANGIIIFSIGLMQNLSPGKIPSARSILQYIASSNPGTTDHYFEAPTADDLLAIYNQIAYLLTSGEAQHLTSSLVANELNQIFFTNVGTDGSPGCVRIQLDILRTNPGGGQEYNATAAIDTSICLRAY